jgi:hypothetical protein
MYALAGFDLRTHKLQSTQAKMIPQGNATRAEKKNSLILKAVPEK